MTTNLPPKYMGYIVLIVIIFAVAAGVISVLYKSGAGERMLLDVLFWIPGMSKIISALGVV
ncbi:MAG: hypothetical protein KJ697_04230 [Nanoarchaeota archaeon]|nr:hypothetical protein [Nanoarchaeota archaeon]